MDILRAHYARLVELYSSRLPDEFVASELEHRLLDYAAEAVRLVPGRGWHPEDVRILLGDRGAHVGTIMDPDELLAYLRR